MCMRVSQTVFTSVSELTRGFFLLFSLSHTHTHTHTHTRVLDMCMCAASCSAMKHQHAVTGQRSVSHMQSHGRTHAHKLRGAPANQLKHCILTLLQYLLLTDCRRETFTHTLSLSLRKHFPEACGRETFTGIRFQPGPRPRLRQKCAYSISICTQHNLTLPSCLTNHTLFILLVVVHVRANIFC